MVKRLSATVNFNPLPLLFLATNLSAKDSLWYRVLTVTDTGVGGIVGAMGVDFVEITGVDSN